MDVLVHRATRDHAHHAHLVHLETPWGGHGRHEAQGVEAWGLQPGVRRAATWMHGAAAPVNCSLPFSERPHFYNLLLTSPNLPLPCYHVYLTRTLTCYLPGPTCYQPCYHFYNLQLTLLPLLQLATYLAHAVCTVDRLPIELRVPIEIV